MKSFGLDSSNFTGIILSSLEEGYSLLEKEIVEYRERKTRYKSQSTALQEVGRNGFKSYEDNVYMIGKVLHDRHQKEGHHKEAYRIYEMMKNAGLELPVSYKKENL